MTLDCVVLDGNKNGRREIIVAAHITRFAPADNLTTRVTLGSYMLIVNTDVDDFLKQYLAAMKGEPQQVG